MASQKCTRLQGQKAARAEMSSAQGGLGGLIALGVGVFLRVHMLFKLQLLIGEGMSYMGLSE